VSLDKISNKKNYFEKDEFFLVLYSKYLKSHYIQVYVEKRMIRTNDASIRKM